MASVVLVPAVAGAFEALHTAAGDPVRWPSMPVSYSLNDAGPQHLSLAEAEGLVAEAFAAWAAAAPTLGFVYQGRVAAPSTDFDPDDPGAALNVVHFNGLPMADDQLAFTLVRYAEADGRLLNAHIFVDEARHEFGPEGPAFDLQSTLMHEVGHFLGLDHSLEPEAVMHSGLVRGDVRAISGDDTQAAWALYAEGDSPPAVDEPPPSGVPLDATGEPEDLGCQAAPGAPWALALVLGVGLRRRR